MPFSLTSLVDDHPQFRTHGGVRDDLQVVCERHSDVASFEELGPSEEGAMLYGIRMGTGSRTVSLIAGNHADEPVGPETLRSFVINALDHRDEMAPWFRRFQFIVVPHTNPDGEARNRPWIEAWPDVTAYLQHVRREEPGRDLEYGYPSMRPENEHVARFLQAHGPMAMHASLHGMSAGEGAMLLINRPWTFRTQTLRDQFVDAAQARGLRMHDHNRKGEKGFFWIEPGFQTTPRGDAMRTFFRAQGDEDTARKFHDSSMEFVMGLGGDPLAMVTELPLFVVENENPTCGYPDEYMRLRRRRPEMRARLERGDDVTDLLASFDLRPVPLKAAMSLQFRAIELGLEAISSESPPGDRPS